MVVVGFEELFVWGIYDYFKVDDVLKQVCVIGFFVQGVKLEGSKVFVKVFMQQCDIFMVAYVEFILEMLEEGFFYIDCYDLFIVLKVDGLVVGKGVLIFNDWVEVKVEFKVMFSGKFGEVSEWVVIEVFLDGIEFFVFVLIDGKFYKILFIVKDYKCIGEGDIGLNIGGMGVIFLVFFVDDMLLKKVENWIVSFIFIGFKELEVFYEGFIFLGLIKVGEDFYVIEYNCWMGDFEMEVVFLCFKSDFVELLAVIGDGILESKKLEVEE